MQYSLKLDNEKYVNDILVFVRFSWNHEFQYKPIHIFDIIVLAFSFIFACKAFQSKIYD